MGNEIAQRMAEFITKTKLEDVPKETVEFAKGLILKTAAGMLCGSRYDAGKRVGEFMSGRKQAPEVSVVGCGFKDSLWNAVFTNSIFAHASELEDDRIVEGGAAWDITVLPVTLALAERNGLTGREFLEASIVGLEIHCRTCMFPSGHLGLTVVPGSIGPAAGAARALRLDVSKTLSALGLSMSGTPLTFLSFGTDSHYFESAMQALQGVMAAELAGVGMTGNPEIGKYLAYLLGKDKVRAEAMVSGLGANWMFQEIWIKKYPCCFGNHRQVDIIRELMKENRLTFDQVAEVENHISRVDRPLDRPEPKSVGDLQFSFQHNLSLAMLEGDLDATGYTQERVATSRLHEARKKVKIVVHNDWPTFLMQSPAIIVMKLKDGRVLTRERMFPIGSPQEPLTMEQFKELYHKFTRGILSEKQIQSTAETILNLEKLADIKALADALRSARAA